MKTVILAHPFAALGTTLAFGGVIIGGTYLALRSTDSTIGAGSSVNIPTSSSGSVSLGEILDRPGPISVNLPNNQVLRLT